MLVSYADESEKKANPTLVPTQYWTREASKDTANFSLREAKFNGFKSMQVFRDKRNGNTCYYWAGDFVCLPGAQIPGTQIPDSVVVKRKPTKSIWWRRK